MSHSRIGIMTGRPSRLAGCWDRQAASYDRRTAGIERRFFAASREWVCQRVHGTTLEIGIGTGANLPYYPAAIELTGIDFSQAMLDAAHRQADRLRRPVTLRRADASALPFDAESFDSVVSTYALCCVLDERAVLVEALRVLRPGGHLLLADHVAAARWPVRSLQRIVDLVSVPWYGEHYTRRPSTVLPGLEVDIQDSERLTLGMLERVHARKR